MKEFAHQPVKSAIKTASAPFFAKKDSQTTGSFFTAATIQPKLEIGRPDDSYEKEADSVADKIVAGQQQIVQTKGISTLQRKCENCEKEEKVQAKFFTSSAVQAQTKSSAAMPEMANLETQLASNRSGGEPLANAVNEKLSNSFGADFSNVRLHTDANAAAMNKSLNARAFTHGNDIYFNQGQFNPNSKTGEHLLAHELTHVVQQGAVGNAVQRELAVEHPNPSAVADQLSQEQIDAAVTFNTARLRSEAEIMVVRDVLGLSHDSPTIDPELVQEVAQFQAENNITIDGKIGPITATRLGQEFSAESRFVGGRSGDADLFRAARRMGTRSFTIDVNEYETPNDTQGSATFGVMWNIADSHANGYIIQHVRFSGNVTDCTGAAATSANAQLSSPYFEAWRVENGFVRCGNLRGACTGSDDTFTTATEAAGTRGTVGVRGNANFFPNYTLDSGWVESAMGVHPAGELPHRSSTPPEWSESSTKTHEMTVVYDSCATPQTTVVTANP